jgi:hypothetical protein
VRSQCDTVWWAAVKTMHVVLHVVQTLNYCTVPCLLAARAVRQVTCPVPCQAYCCCQQQAAVLCMRMYFEIE